MLLFCAVLTKKVLISKDENADYTPDLCIYRVVRYYNANIKEAHKSIRCYI